MTKDREPNGATQSVAAQLVDRLIAAGCDMMAIGPGYIVNEPAEPEARAEVVLILQSFGPRDHLRDEIAAYLRSIGRAVDF